MLKMLLLGFLLVSQNGFADSIALTIVDSLPISRTTNKVSITSQRNDSVCIKWISPLKWDYRIVPETVDSIKIFFKLGSGDSLLKCSITKPTDTSRTLQIPTTSSTVDSLFILSYFSNPDTTIIGQDGGFSVPAGSRIGRSETKCIRAVTEMELNNEIHENINVHILSNNVNISTLAELIENVSILSVSGKVLRKINGNNKKSLWINVHGIAQSRLIFKIKTNRKIITKVIPNVK